MHRTQMRPTRSASAISQARPATIRASPTAAEPMSLTRPICGSISRDTRSASFSIAVFKSSTTKSNSTSAISASRFQAVSVTRNASGTESTRTNSSWRNASSLRVAARKPFQELTAARSNLSMDNSAVIPMLKRQPKSARRGPDCTAFGRSSSVYVDNRIRTELVACLHEHPGVLHFPVDRLGQRDETVDVVLEMGEAVALHPPITPADADTQPPVDAIRQHGFELITPPLAILGDG